jgi:hypothetical protein
MLTMGVTKGDLVLVSPIRYLAEEHTGVMLLFETERALNVCAPTLAMSVKRLRITLAGLPIEDPALKILVNHELKPTRLARRQALNVPPKNI